MRLPGDDAREQLLESTSSAFCKRVHALMQLGINRIGNQALATVALEAGELHDDFGDMTPALACYCAGQFSEFDQRRVVKTTQGVVGAPIIEARRGSRQGDHPGELAGRDWLSPHVRTGRAQRLCGRLGTEGIQNRDCAGRKPIS